MRNKSVAQVVTTGCLFLALGSPAEAHQARSHAAIAQFKKMHPCPANGRKTGPCPGWVIDHIVALACLGPDRPENMQWQTVEDAKAKDRVERVGCPRAQGGHAQSQDAVPQR